MTVAPSNTRKNAGFTLAELLVVLLLLGLISVVLFGGLRFTGRVWERASETGATIDTVEATQGFLRRYMAQGAGFQGEANEVTFSAPVAAHHGMGGIYTFRLWLEDDDETGRLMTAWVPERQDDSRRDSGTAGFDDAEPLLLLEGVEGLYISYFGQADGGGEHAWHETWGERHVLPAMIQIAITFPDESAYQWPVMTVAPMLD